MATYTLKIFKKSTWYINNGCLSHMAIDKDLLISLDKSDKSKVKLGNGEVV